MNDYIFKTQPWEHQLAALHYLYKRDCAALYCDMGTGKTKVMIDLIQNRGFKRVLIVCPNKLAVNKVWENQIRIHGFDNRISALGLAKLSGKEKVRVLREALHGGNLDTKMSLVIIVNYEAVWRDPLARTLLAKRTGIDCVICDESHRIKSPGSKCSRFLTKIGKQVKHRYLMTGTPLAENPCDVYAQYRFLDPTIFGTNFQSFKAEYENIDPARTARVGYTVLDKKQPYKNLRILRKKMFSCAFKAKSSVWLPKTRSIKVEFEMSQAAQKIYKQVKSDGALELDGEFMEVNNVLTLITRLQQITSGYAAMEDDDGNKTLRKIDSSREEMLSELLQQLPEDEPVVVFAKYRADLKAVSDVCRALQRGHSELSGKVDTLQDWKDGKTSVLAVQYSSGSEGEDFTRAHYCIYYSLTHSLALYRQSRKRVHRPPQNKPVVYYHLVAKMDKGSTIDEDILQALKSKKDVVQSIMNNKTLL